MEKRISGRTGLLALFGRPVGHSGSPAMYNFSFARTGLDYVYLAFEVGPENLKEALAAMRLLNLRGANVTMPCKNIAAELVDELSPAARIVGAINTIVNDGGRLTGHITDGLGFVRALNEEGVEVRGKKIVVLGAGGAGTALQVQCALDGARSIQVFNQDDSFLVRAGQTAVKLAEAAPACKIEVHDLADARRLAEEIASADILVNSTSVGMKPDQDRTLAAKELLHPGLVVSDTVYNPEKTRLILEAEEKGLTAIGGRGMLLWQGAAAFKLFTGLEMPAYEYQEFQKTAGSR